MATEAESINTANPQALDNGSFADVVDEALPESMDSWQDISLSMLESLFGIWSS